MITLKLLDYVAPLLIKDSRVFDVFSWLTP